MAEANENPDRPPTIIGDIPRQARLPLAGGLIAFVGLLVRCFARWLAWPSEWKYYGDRANTVWAYHESLYADLGLVALVFGLALVFLAIARSTLQRRTST